MELTTDLLCNRSSVAIGATERCSKWRERERESEKVIRIDEERYRRCASTREREERARHLHTQTKKKKSGVCNSERALRDRIQQPHLAVLQFYISCAARSRHFFLFKCSTFSVVKHVSTTQRQPRPTKTTAAQKGDNVLKSFITVKRFSETDADQHPSPSGYPLKKKNKKLSYVNSKRKGCRDKGTRFFFFFWSCL